ncbi:MAG TPA: neutral zinc metallopeptidase [Mycobacteriales bacterium]|nr:neutral zinc metallopeptidase [Mycobacteriales bacterium]
MRWQSGGRSGNLEDRRGSRAGGMGGLGGLPLGRGGGIGGVIVMLVLAILGGSRVLGGGGGGGFQIEDVLNQIPAAQAPAGGQPLPGAPDPDAKLVDFVSFVLDDVQTMWAEQFRAGGQRYGDAKLVLFTAAVSSGCGQASSETGPFYCQLDRTVYVDLEFFRELSRRFKAPGDFAQAYVIAHEIAHHVQNELGIANRVRALREKNPDDSNELSVRQELQADCLAGVWAHSTYQRGILEAGDLEEGLGAAAAVGDDRIQKSVTGRVDPESFTHGTSEQRMTWFRRGFENGDADNCDSFAADEI